MRGTATVFAEEQRIPDKLFDPSEIFFQNYLAEVIFFVASLIAVA